MKTLHGYDKIITKGHTSRKNSLLCPHDTTMQILDCLQLKSFEYQVCSAHQDIQSLYRLFFYSRKVEQNVVQISQACDIVLENLYEIQEFVTSV